MNGIELATNLESLISHPSSAGRKDAGGRYFKRAKYESALERLIFKNWELHFSRNADMMRHAQIGHLRTKHFWSYQSWSGSPPFWLFLGCLVTVKLRRYSLVSEMLQHRDDIKVPILQVIFLMERPPCVGRPTGKWPSRRRTTPCGHKRKRWNRPVNWTLSRAQSKILETCFGHETFRRQIIHTASYRRFQWWINRRQASFHPTCGCCDSS